MANRFIVIFLTGLIMAVWCGRALSAESLAHPLDPLTEQEYQAVVQVLKKKSHRDLVGLYPLITLHEPSKEVVLAWKPGDVVKRHAFVIIKGRSRTFEAVVDIDAKTIVSWTPVEDVQPSVLLSEEWAFARKLVMGNETWQESIRKRGISNLRDVVCIPHTVGYYGMAQETKRRLLKVTCYNSQGIKNFWGRPITGLIAVVDQTAGKVINIIDTGVVPIPNVPTDFNRGPVKESRQPTSPILLAQTPKPRVAIRGQVVNWQNWQFHFRIDPRLGPIISTVRYNDRGRMRSILYQGSLSELFVPYMDPSEGWYFRTYMDIGEYGIGKLVSSLQVGADCPDNATFFNAVFADDWGLVYKRDRAACLFERYAGNIAWRHFEAVTGETEVRKRIDLVLRLISTIGNYDYVFDWIFRQDGAIEIAVGSTGTEQVKAVDSRVISDDQDGRSTAYGHMVAKHTLAIHHDHFFCFRLDFDVDGSRNSFLLEQIQTHAVQTESPRKSIWVVKPKILATEQAAKLRIDLERPALWRVINPHITGSLGYPVSYRLKPKANSISLLSSDDYPQKRAGFTDFHLWVTPYAAQERFAAGVYPNQSKGFEGLPEWTSANRPIQDVDLVLWYTLGFHHVVRSEDWPILSTEWNGFELLPFDFFPRNPALDLPN